jgi:PAS domain S-box-containing protein
LGSSNIENELETFRNRMRSLREQLAQIPSSAQSPQTAQQLELACEELHVAHEELTAQADELARTQGVLEQERQRYADLFEMAPDGYLLTDQMGVIREANRAATELLERTPEYLHGKPLVNYVSSGDLRVFRKLVNDVGRPHALRTQTELRLRRQDERTFDAAVTVAPDRAPGNGKVRGLRWMFRDITEQKGADRRIRELNASLENRVSQRTAELATANRAKDQFLAVLSHELRTPLAPVLSAVTALAAEPSLSDELRSMMGMIQRNIELEARLIDDLLDLTRVSRGRLTLESAPTEVHRLLLDVIDICRSEGQAKRLTLEHEFGAARSVVNGDPARLHQIFWNLVRNAVKFTDTGGRITVRTSNPQDSELLHVEVEDTGVGIAPEMLPRVFGAFEQGQRPGMNSRAAGLGLGLTFARALVEAHGGTIRAESAGAGAGARFTVELPVSSTRSSAEDQAAGEASALSALTFGAARGGDDRKPRILLVEDHPDTLRVLVRLLRNAGYSVEGAANVREALQFAAAEPFDLIISDLGLPDGSGNDLVRELRSRHRVRSSIALSGFGMEDDVKRSLDAGFDGHLTKPVSFQKLLAMIRNMTVAQ